MDNGGEKEIWRTVHIHERCSALNNSLAQSQKLISSKLQNLRDFAFIHCMSNGNSQEVHEPRWLSEQPYPTWNHFSN